MGERPSAGEGRADHSKVFNNESFRGNRELFNFSNRFKGDTHEQDKAVCSFFMTLFLVVLHQYPNSVFKPNNELCFKRFVFSVPYTNFTKLFFLF